MSIALLAALSLSTPVQAAGFCPTTDWADVVAYSTGDFLYGGVRAIGLGGKGQITAAGEIEFDAYQNGVGHLGSADVDSGSTLTMTGSVTAFDALSYGTDCSDKASLRYFIDAEVSGVSFWVFIY